jgi:hypothetical protein
MTTLDQRLRMVALDRLFIREPELRKHTCVLSHRAPDMDPRCVLITCCFGAIEFHIGDREYQCISNVH